MKKIIDKWWDKGNKNFSIISYYHCWNKPIFKYFTNGARKGIDNCQDITLHLGFLSINYTNFNYKEAETNDKGI